MMNWYFDGRIGGPTVVTFQNLSRRSEENHDIPQSGLPVSRSKFQPSISKIRVKRFTATPNLPVQPL
jgi:hypothetical protein